MNKSSSSSTQYYSFVKSDVTYIKRLLLMSWFIVSRINRQNFVQISKHAIINIDHLLSLSDSFSGNMTARLTNNIKSSVSRKYAPLLILDYLVCRKGANMKNCNFMLEGLYGSFSYLLTFSFSNPRITCYDSNILSILIMSALIGLFFPVAWNWTFFFLFGSWRFIFSYFNGG